MKAILLEYFDIESKKIIIIYFLTNIYVKLKVKKLTFNNQL